MPHHWPQHVLNAIEGVAKGLERAINTQVNTPRKSGPALQLAEPKARRREVVT